MVICSQLEYHFKGLTAQALGVCQYIIKHTRTLSWKVQQGLKKVPAIGTAKIQLFRKFSTTYAKIKIF